MKITGWGKRSDGEERGARKSFDQHERFITAGALVFRRWSKALLCREVIRKPGAHTKTENARCCAAASRAMGYTRARLETAV